MGKFNFIERKSIEKMTKILFKKYNSKYMLFEGDRNDYKNVCTQVDGRWLREKGWVIPITSTDKFTSIVKIAFPTVTLVDELPPKDEPKNEDESQESTGEFVPNPVMPDESVSTIYRARSAKKVASRSRIKPRERKVLVDDTDIALSSSSEEDSDSDSSADYPSRSPTRKGYINESAISKMNMANRRLLELELEDK